MTHRFAKHTRAHRRGLATAALFLAWTVLVVLGGFTMGGCQNYDRLVDADQVCQQKWADVEAQLQRRYDLVPSLVETVRGAAKQEQDTLTKITEARTQAVAIKMNAEDLQDPVKMEAFQKAQEQLRGSLGRLMVITEKYPELKSSEAFHGLMVQLEGTENRVLRSREEYNAAVRSYNSELGKVRGQVVNKATGHPFKARPYFAASSADVQAAPKVSF
jgi:LemA protein